MATRHRRTTFLSRLPAPVLMIAMIVYFGWHGVHGDYGIRARLAFETEIARLVADRDAIVERRKDLEARVKLLQSAAIDADMLDERARAKLNLARPEEVVIYTSPGLAGDARVSQLPATLSDAGRVALR
ncbi:FtsB family cell division protein [Amorphus coralli]|uniref:FtsB family cell division protein n=1 Tax=Amorphus coralli TaxID=340680 RepID=UPI00037A4E86|nr:septum formation initiator family protein [Amorphus coralli]